MGEVESLVALEVGFVSAFLGPVELRRSATHQVGDGT
jgi:hypothetical protein